MDLKTYIRLSGMRYADFAKLIDVDVTTVSNYINWRRRPSSEVVRRIELLTKGKVSLHDLMGYWEARKK